MADPRIAAPNGLLNCARIIPTGVIETPMIFNVIFISNLRVIL